VVLGLDKLLASQRVSESASQRGWLACPSGLLSGGFLKCASLVREANPTHPAETGINGPPKTLMRAATLRASGGYGGGVGGRCKVVGWAEESQDGKKRKRETKREGCDGLSYAKDIRPLFREGDVRCMKPAGIALDDAGWMCVGGECGAGVWAVSAGKMPPDAPWPKSGSRCSRRGWMQGCRGRVQLRRIGE